VRLVNGFTPDGSVPAVVSDERQGGRLATQVLIDGGHRRIGFLNAPESTAPATTERLAGYREALAAAAIEQDASLIVRVVAEQEGGYAGAMTLLDRPDRPSAVFCYNDRVAMGAYAAAAQLGLAIPGDVAVIGFDNQEVIAAHLRPRLSTIALPHYEMGHRGLSRLLGIIGGDEDGQAIERLPCPYVPRDSV
jgi:LacI family transcriptional regulator